MQTNNDSVTRLRLFMIRSGLEMELRGMRLTAKAPRCFKIIKDEFGIQFSPRNKYAGYLAFCAMYGFEPKPQESLQKL